LITSELVLISLCVRPDPGCRGVVPRLTA
jgi:hypothetical protein